MPRYLKNGECRRREVSTLLLLFFFSVLDSSIDRPLETVRWRRADMAQLQELMHIWTGNGAFTYQTAVASIVRIEQLLFFWKCCGHRIDGRLVGACWAPSCMDR
jgi:hypothetical protein